jgi:hypothetical protein
MNNIQEDDWADDSWSRHSGMWINDESEKEDNDEEDNGNSEEFEHQQDLK